MTATNELTRSAPAAARSTVLTVAGVTVAYPDGVGEDGAPRTLSALDDVSLSADRGTVTGVLGPSGSGKSTLLSVVAGLVVPVSGTVTIDGVDLTALDEEARTRVRRDRVGMVFQQPQLLAALSARDQLVVTAHLAGARGRRLRAARRRADELLERVGLAGRASRMPHELSGGQRQRVNVARALMASPTVLLVDEPTSALDRERARDVVGLLVEVTRELDLATLLVTHDAQAARAADRVVTVRDGRVRAAP